MKTNWWIVVFCFLMVGSFLAGSLFNRRVSASRGEGVATRVIRYYRDPMHPSYTSDKPGIAPDCGMQLEPVYADTVQPTRRTTDAAPETTRISTDIQRTIGIVLDRVQKGSITSTERVLGRVALDESRIYPLTAGADGWIKGVFSASTDSTVRKGQPLVSVYGHEYLTAQRAFLYALRTMENPSLRASTTEYQDQPAFALEEARLNLQTIGLGEDQLRQIERERKPLLSITLTAPAAGFVVTRNAYPAQRFTRGTELFRIADISRVWIIAEVFGEEAQHIHSGDNVRVSSPNLPGQSMRAVVSAAQPHFDASARALQVRIEADNPGLSLRPDMFVDVEFSESLPAAVTIPAEAVIDSGLRKTVFVARGNGVFEPRSVQTGRHLGDRVQIVRGLEQGESVVVSGNFLLDSERRIRMPAGSRSRDLPRSTGDSPSNGTRGHD